MVYRSEVKNLEYTSFKNDIQRSRIDGYYMLTMDMAKALNLSDGDIIIDKNGVYCTAEYFTNPFTHGPQVSGFRLRPVQPSHFYDNPCCEIDLEPIAIKEVTKQKSKLLLL